EGRRDMPAPGRCPRHEIAEEVDVGEADGVAAASTLDDPVGNEPERNEEQADEQRRGGEGHERIPWMRSCPASDRSQPPDVERTMWSMPSRRKSAASRARSWTAAVANRSRKLRDDVSTRTSRPVPASP